MKMKRWMPFVMIGLMLLAMFGVMAVFSLFLGEMNPLAMMLPGNGNLGSGMWNVMLILFLGMLAMFTLMFFVFRWMTGNKKGSMSMMMGTRSDLMTQREKTNLTTMTFNIPTVSCTHCKMTIEEELIKLPGVAYVNVDVDLKQASIELIVPPTKSEIQTLLTEIGYPPEGQ